MEVLGADAGHWVRPVAVLCLSAASAVGAVWVARRRPETALIDLQSMQQPSYAQSVYGGTAYRAAVSVLPFLLPLMFQVGFRVSAFRSGLYILALFAGDLSMKALVVPVLRRWGFRRVLLFNGVLTAGSLALCAVLTPATPVALLLLVLYVHGAGRSMEFTAIGTLSYADIPEARLSRANGFLSAVVQLGMGLGVPVGAISLRMMARLHGDSLGAPALRDFHGAILVGAVLALGPVVNAWGLGEDAGCVASGHRRVEAIESAAV
jgi:hypothetical protein